ncbi:hypothetical protein CesoFtcFv8_026104 [Champsocephalus esox]|uniref:Uncharacterized protein n=1 Tax=Champsocephalus esox TaxID=159716 RepID=A0AAN8GCK4_9TELE|nr:hypothetical protein CesoFtcFv8_026104 [Champsocephalus esox]
MTTYATILHNASDILRLYQNVYLPKSCATGTLHCSLAPSHQRLTVFPISPKPVPLCQQLDQHSKRTVQRAAKHLLCYCPSLKGSTIALHLLQRNIQKNIHEK